MVVPMTATETQTAQLPGVYAFAGADSDVSLFTTGFERNDDKGTATITDWPVFKAGTFADSFGFVETWTTEHLAQLVSNFELLKPVLVNIPVRADHGRSIEKVKGYVTALRVAEGVLLADVVLTEPDAVEKYERGTYRSRSAEIGFYETNEGAAYYPVFLGVAFVDIPAVEGLFSKATDQHPSTRYFTEASPQMTTTSNPAAQAGDTAPALRPSGSEPVTTTVTVQSGGQFTAPATTTNPTMAPAPSTPAAPPAGPTQPGAPAVQVPPPIDQPAPAPTAAAAPAGTQKFTVNGEEMDLDTIATRLAAAQNFEKEQMEATRTAFVKGLVDTNKVAAPQRESMEAFAKSLTPEQFTAWSATFEGAPELSLLANHGAGVSNPNNANGGTPLTEAQQEIKTAEETVKMHERSGMSQADIEKTASYQKLQAAKAAGASS